MWLEVDDAVAQKLQQLSELAGLSVQDYLAQHVEAASTQRPLYEQRLEAIVNLAADAIISIDAQERIIFCNAAVQSIFGYAPQELIGQPLGVLLPTDTTQTHSQHIKRFLQEPIASRAMNNRAKIHGRRADGSLFPARASISKIQEGDRVVLTVMLADITREEQDKAALAESEQRYRIVSELSSDYAYAYDIADDGRPLFVWITDAYERITGYTVEEYQQSDLLLPTIHQEDMPLVLETWGKMLQDGGTYDYVTRIYRKDGEIRYLRSRQMAVRNEQNTRTVRIYGASTDITQRKVAEAALEQERKFLRDIMDTSPSSITVVDATGKIVFVNERASQMQGVEPDEATERTYNDPKWRHTDYEGNPWPDEKQPFVVVMKTKQPVWDIRHAIEDQYGRRKYLSINGIPQLDENGEVQRIVFSVEDISAQKALEDDIKRALEREIEMNELKSRFLSMVSHEFKNPLAVIMTSTSILRMQKAYLTYERLEDRLHMIESQVRRLSQLLDDVSLINRAQFIGRNLDLRMIDLPEYVSAIIQEVQMAYPQHAQIYVNLDGLRTATLLTDEVYLHQIINNLLSNALKYTPPERPVYIHCHTHEHLPHVVIEIQDEGIGIPQEDQTDIFKAFRRASNVGEIEGTGLGLAIVKYSVDALKGEIRFKSQVGQGTHFWVSLPLSEDAIS